MHLEVAVGTVSKKLGAVWPKVGKPGDVLFRRRGGCLMQVERGHPSLLLLPSKILSLEGRYYDSGRSGGASGLGDAAKPSVIGVARAQEKRST